MNLAIKLVKREFAINTGDMFGILSNGCIGGHKQEGCSRSIDLQSLSRIEEEELRFDPQAYNFGGK